MGDLLDPNYPSPKNHSTICYCWFLLLIKNLLKLSPYQSDSHGVQEGVCFSSAMDGASGDMIDRGERRAPLG
jgi:hypothetical protein